MLEFPEWIFREFLKPENIYFDEGTSWVKLNLADRNFSINSRFDYDFKVVNLIGIAVCLHPRFILHTDGFAENPSAFSEEIHSEIEREVLDLYENNPEFVEKIESLLEKANRRYWFSDKDLNVPPALYS
ncbi:hypothetical protein HY449_03715 [Candidatus Pacearchaeota archaeon]|nr:hypothetical protein [Candidatus Pacearchaeota archaeon]